MNKIKCYGCKNVDLLQEFNGVCPYCKGKGWYIRIIYKKTDYYFADVTEETLAELIKEDTLMSGSDIPLESSSFLYPSEFSFDRIECVKEK